MIRPRIRDDQIAETLRRHGYPADTEVLGIVREGDLVTVNVAGKRLEVPQDVLAMPAASVETRESVLGW